MLLLRPANPGIWSYTFDNDAAQYTTQINGTKLCQNSGDTMDIMN